jgi:hypothetical protein
MSASLIGPYQRLAECRQQSCFTSAVKETQKMSIRLADCHC